MCFLCRLVLFISSARTALWKTPCSLNRASEICLLTYLLTYLRTYLQWRRLHRAWGHVPPTFTNGWAREAPSVEHQQIRNWSNCILNTTKALVKTTNCTFRDKRWRGTTKNFFGALCVRLVPPPTFALDRCLAPTFKFVLAPLLTCVISVCLCVCSSWGVML